jgi:hypothetical protein
MTTLNDWSNDRNEAIEIVGVSSLCEKRTFDTLTRVRSLAPRSKESQRRVASFSQEKQKPTTANRKRCRDAVSKACSVYLYMVAVGITITTLSQHYAFPIFSQRDGGIEGQAAVGLSRTPESSASTVEHFQPDGSFNGHSIYYRENAASMRSTVHCVGENFGADSWLYRSCQFRNLCFDVGTRNFVLYPSIFEQRLTEQIRKRRDRLVTLSTLSESSVALGAVNPKWKGNKYLLEWFPEKRSRPPGSGYYELPADIVWVPFHLFSAMNAGHLVLNDFLPIFTLLSMFGQHQEERKLLLTRIVIGSLPETCDHDEVTRSSCERLFRKFLPAMGISPIQFSTQNDFRLNLKTQGTSKSNIVCAKHGVAGIGMLSKQGTQMHTWSREALNHTHQIGHGVVLQQFRKYMMDNLAIAYDSKSLSTNRFVITFSLPRTIGDGISYDFSEQIEKVRNAFAVDTVLVNSFNFEDVEVNQQARIASESSVFITLSRDEDVTAIFVASGSSLIFFYDDTGSMGVDIHSIEPARQEWDLFGNAGYLRTHWLPIQTMYTSKDLEVLISVLRDELNLAALK